MWRGKRYWVALLLLFTPISVLSAPPDFHLMGQLVPPGSVRSWMQPVATTAIPLTVIHGQHAGPVLTLTAGIHGDEYPGIFALQKLLNMLQPSTLHGTVVLVHLANLEGFHARRIALNPVDEKNLNRVFPGRAAGSLTEQIAYFMTEHVIRQTDYVLDIHAGSANQTLLPHVYSPVMDEAMLDARTLAFAKSLAIPHIVLYGERPRDPAQSVSYPNTAQTRGKPGLTLELGQLGGRADEDRDRIVQACLQAMHHLNMLDQPVAHAAQHAAPVLYRTLVSVRSPVSGIFYPMVKVGDSVVVGQAVGRVEDYFGQPLQTLYAPVAGTVLMQMATPPIREGESSTEIGVILTATQASAYGFANTGSCSNCSTVSGFSSNK